MTDLASPDAFTRYQAELAAEGVDPEIRIFLDEQLREGDVYLDVGAEWGLHALHAATAPARRVQVVCVTQSEARAELLRRNAADNGVGESVDIVVYADLDNAAVNELVYESLEQTGGRVFLRVASADALPGVLARCAEFIESGRLASVIWPCQRRLSSGDPKLSTGFVAQTLESLNYAHFAVVEDDQGPVLVPYDAVPEARLVFSLASNMLEEQQQPDSLTGALVTLLSETTGSGLTLASDLRVEVELTGEPWSGEWMQCLEVVARLQASGSVRPVLLGGLDMWAFAAEERRRLEPALHLGREIAASRAKGSSRAEGQVATLYWVGDQLEPLVEMALQPHGRVVALACFEDSRFDANALERAHGFDLILVGSNWAAEALRSHGVAHVEVAAPLVHTPKLPPRRRQGWFGDRFVILSAGPLSRAGGQDLIVPAFREFHRRHSDAVLLACWHNPDLASIGDLGRSGHVEGLPEMNAYGQLDLRPWLSANGIDTDAVIDPGPTYAARFAELLRESDVAVFPDRCATGWSPFPARSIASEVPTLCSASTGHLDLLDQGYGVPLGIHPYPSSASTPEQGWGEVAIDTIVEALDNSYAQSCRGPG